MAAGAHGTRLNDMVSDDEVEPSHTHNAVRSSKMDSFHSSRKPGTLTRYHLLRSCLLLTYGVCIVIRNLTSALSDLKGMYQTAK